MARNSKSGFSRKWSAFFAAVIILGGMAISLGFAVRLRSALQRNADSRMTTASVALRTTVEEQLARYIDTVRLSAAAMASQPQPTAAAFLQISTAVASQDLTAVQAMRFVVPAAADENLTAVRDRWRDRGAAKLTLGPAKGVQSHLFTVFARGLGGRTAPPLGVDQSAAPAEVEVVRLARGSDAVAISDAYHLLNTAGTDLSFDVVAPVPAASGAVAGFVMLSVGGTEFISTLLKRAAGDLLDGQLLTRSSSGTLTQLAVVLHGDRAADIKYAQNFETGHRQWVLRTSTDNRTLLPTAGRTDMAVLLAGSVLAVMFGTLLYLQMSSAQRIEQEILLEVKERMAQERTAGSAKPDLAETQPEPEHSPL